jgi:hypothetical protein
VHPGRETSMNDFSCLGGTGYGFNKNCPGTRYAELVFFHLLGFVGYVVHSGASNARNIGTRTRYVELVVSHLVGSTDHIVHYGTFGT